MNIDNYYWTFSAAAQGIAALFGFLLANVALAFQMMDRIADRDPTLLEVIESLKSKYHSKMTGLAIVTGTAIIGSLFATFLNPHPCGLRTFVMIVAAASSILAIIWAIFFVVQIVSPGRYAKQADEELSNIVKGSPFDEANIKTDNFVTEFISLEKDIREWLLSRDPAVLNRVEFRSVLSFRQMIDYIFQREMIDSSLRDDLLSVNKFRNLLIHGHTDRVPLDMIDKLRAAREKWDRIKK